MGTTKLVSDAYFVSHDWIGGIEATTVQILMGSACLILPLIFVFCHGSSSKIKSSDSRIPSAPGAIPFLGHALLYKSDPPLFLKKSQAAVGSIFRINLAGRKMILVGADDSLQGQMCREPESNLSSRLAVAAVGFDYTLGRDNVFLGTDFHKRLLKNTVYQDWNAFCQLTTQTMDVALNRELQKLHHKHNKTTAMGEDTGITVTVPDVFQLARKTILNTILSVFCGSCMVQDDSLLEDIMMLQDKIEDATAAGAVLPRWISIPLVYGPTRQVRLKVQAKMGRLIEEARIKHQLRRHEQQPKEESNGTSKDQDYFNAESFYGPWLKCMDEEGISNERIAELIVGLVFAAHKNPAIGAAQSFCHLVEHSQMDMSSVLRSITNINDGIQSDLTEPISLWKSVENEAEAIVSQTPSLSWDKMEQMTPILRACVAETTRLTAHSIGSIRNVCHETQLLNSQGQSVTVYPGETIAASHYLYNVDSTLFPHQESQYRPDYVAQTTTTTTTAESSVQENKTEGPPRVLPKTFSAGIHKCAGERIAMILMEFFVALLFKRKAQLQLNSLPPISFERATLAQRDGPVPILLSL